MAGAQVDGRGFARIWCGRRPGAKRCSGDGTLSVRVAVYLTSEIYRGDTSWLQPADAARLARFRHAGAAAQFVTGRHLLRHALDAHGLAYGDVDLTAEKPAHPGIAFNLSHVEGLVGVALASRPLGLDVETTLRNTDIESVGRRQYTERELAWMHAQPDPRRAFFQLWTRKEAYMKLTGEGFRRPTKSFEFLDDLQTFVPPADRPVLTRFWQTSIAEFEVALALDEAFQPTIHRIS